MTPHEVNAKERGKESRRQKREEASERVERARMPICRVCAQGKRASSFEGTTGKEGLRVRVAVEHAHEVKNCKKK